MFSGLLDIVHRLRASGCPTMAGIFETEGQRRIDAICERLERNARDCVTAIEMFGLEPYDDWGALVDAEPDLAPYCSIYDAHVERERALLRECMCDGTGRVSYGDGQLDQDCPLCG